MSTRLTAKQKELVRRLACTVLGQARARGLRVGTVTIRQAEEVFSEMSHLGSPIVDEVGDLWENSRPFGRAFDRWITDLQEPRAGV